MNARALLIGFSAIIPTVGILLFTSSAFAKCEKGGKTVFSCMTAKGKIIEICDAGKVIKYSFGKPKLKPEIVIRVPRNQVSDWDRPVATYHFYAVNIPNGNTIYRVWTNIDWRVNNDSVDGGDLTAGVDVRIKDEDVATIKCTDNTILNDFPMLDLSQQE